MSPQQCVKGTFPTSFSNHSEDARHLQVDGWKLSARGLRERTQIFAIAKEGRFRSRNADLLRWLRTSLITPTVPLVYPDREGKMRWQAHMLEAPEDLFSKKCVMKLSTSNLKKIGGLRRSA